MIKKRKTQLSFAQLQVNSCIDKAHWLHNVNNILNWEPIRHKFADLHPSNTGRPAYDPVFMFKVLLLEQWFNLSDPQAEAQINDRISFKVFLGMDITETGPDETTICNFRNYIGSLGLTEELFEEINRQFEGKGLVIKTGTLIDASFYQASTRPPIKGKDAKDPDASWGVKGKGKNKKYCYGYKLHVGVDQDSGIIRQAEITEARINDHEVFDELISGDEQGVYADKAYYDKERAEELATKGMKNGLMKRGARGKPLSESDKARNKRLSRIRAQVERPFGIIKSKWGHNRARYLGLFRNKVHLLLIFIAYNMRRAYSLSVI
jgi:IS5 family transposase